LPTGPGAESRTARMVAGEDVMGLPSSRGSRMRTYTGHDRITF